MMTAHKGMNISEQEYLAVMDDIVEAFSKNNISEDAVKDERRFEIAGTTTAVSLAPSPASQG